MSPHLFIQPMDVLLFRDGRPFSAGSDHHAESMFPPYPSVIQGAIRSYQLARLGVDLHNRADIENVVGKPNTYGSLHLRGPFLAKKDSQGKITRYFPQPADAQKVSRGVIKQADKPRILPANVGTNSPTPMLIGWNDPPQKGESGLWLTEESLYQYLDGKAVKTIPETDLFITENRFGIGTNSTTGTTLQGALYEVSFVRLQQSVGLLVEMEGDGYDTWDQTGVLQLGGESRSATYEVVTLPPLQPPPFSIPRRFKLYFATPTYFSKGWIPSSWNLFFDGQIILQAAAVGRYESVGGVNLAHDPKRPDELHRPSRRYVPAGSVYYFSQEGSETVRFKPSLIQKAITEIGAEIGYGQIILKEW